MPEHPRGGASLPAELSPTDSEPKPNQGALGSTGGGKARYLPNMSIRLERAGFALISTLGALLGCTAASPNGSSIALHLLTPKGVLDNADTVTLAVYDASVVGCNADGTLNASPPTDPSMILLAPVAMTGSGCPNQPGGTTPYKWCLSGSLPLDPTRPLTWYVAGTKTGTPEFYGCTQQAVDQDPVSVDITVDPYVPGSRCGDGNIIPPKTCDPGGTGMSDEACNASTCTTNEVIVSNGVAANQFYRGNPGRKTSIGGMWIGGAFVAVWSDAATNSSGGDGGPEITARRLTQDLVTVSKPAVLKAEVRLPRGGSTATSGGTKVRSGSATQPAIAQLSDVTGGNTEFVTVFAQSASGANADLRLMATVQNSGLVAPTLDDTRVSKAEVQQDQPAVAVNANDLALVVWRTPNGIHSSIFNPKTSMFSSEIGVSSGASDATPQVAAVGSDFIVTWSDGADIYMIRVGSDGVPKGSQALVNTGARQAGTQDSPAVAGFATGDFVIAWRDGAGDVGSDIRLQKFDTKGNPTGSEVTAIVNNVHNAGDQTQPSIAAGIAKGGQRYYLVAWNSAPDQQIAARYLAADASGYLQSTLNATGTDGDFFVGIGMSPRSGPATAISASNPGYAAVLWSDDGAGTPGGDDNRVRVRRLPGPYVPN